MCSCFQQQGRDTEQRGSAMGGWGRVKVARREGTSGGQLGGDESGRAV